MSKVKGIQIFNNKTSDGDSVEFKVITPDSRSFSDTEHSNYLSFYGGNGGGTISLLKKMLNGEFRILVAETAEINSIFPSNPLTEASIFGLNHKADSIFKINLDGATSPTLSVDGEGFKFTTS